MLVNDALPFLITPAIAFSIPFVGGYAFSRIGRYLDDRAAARTMIKRGYQISTEGKNVPLPGFESSYEYEWYDLLPRINSGVSVAQRKVTL